MSRIRCALGLCIVTLIASPVSFGQTDKKVADAIAEIAVLKRLVAEQGRRITELEKALAALQGEAGIKPSTPPSGSRPAFVLPPSSATPASPVRGDSSTLREPAWKQSATWSRLKDGMSRAQVESILGRSTSVESIGPFMTLFYKGEVAGSGSVTGTVKLQDDRVWQVNIPVF